MPHSRAVHVTFRPFFLSLILISSYPIALYAQSSESDPAISPVTGSVDSHRGDTPHHEGGSVEATGPALRDKLFLRQSITDQRMDIKLSEVASHRASRDDIKLLADSMIADHTRISEALTSAAESQGVMLPAKLPLREQAIYDRVGSLSGEDFDREYIKTLVENHRKALRSFKSEAASTQDPGLRDEVQNAIMMLHHHMVAAEQIARSKGSKLSRSERVAVSPAPQ